MGLLIPCPLLTFSLIHTHTLPKCVPLAFSSISHLLCDLGQVLFLSRPASATCTMKVLGSSCGWWSASLMSCGPTLSVDPSPFLTALRLQVRWMGPQIPGSQEVLGVPWASLSPVSESYNIPKVLMQPEPILQEKGAYSIPSYLCTRVAVRTFLT